MTLPPSLERFGPKLERAVERDLRATQRRRRRSVLRLGTVAAAAAVALALLFVGLPGRDGEGGGPTAVERAEAALAGAGILHVRIVGDQDNGDGTSATWSNELWVQTAAPFAGRSLERSGDETPAESETTADGAARLYDPATDTIYESAPGAHGDAADAQPPRSGDLLAELEDGTRVYIGDNGNKVRVAPGEPVPAFSGEPIAGAASEPAAEETVNDPLEPFRAEIRAVLGSPTVRELERVERDGRELVRFADGSSTYLVDAGTYEPVELTTRGTSGGVVLTFEAYERLPDSAENRALLTLEAQHPGAAVVRDQAAFDEAMARLYPHG